MIQPSRPPLSGPAGKDGSVSSRALLSAMVLGRSADGNWIVEAGGRRLSLPGQLALSPGQSIQIPHPQSAGKALSPGIVYDPAPQRSADPLVESFVRSGMAIPRESVLDKLRRAVSGCGGDRSSARLAALLYDKGVEANVPILNDLTDVLDDSARRRKRERRRRGGDLSAEALLVFNHSRGRHGQWFMLPLDPAMLAGARRIVFKGFVPPGAAALDRCVLSVSTAAGVWHFCWNAADARQPLSVHAPRAIEPDTRSIESLAANLRRLGHILDDRMKNGETFDGFDGSEHG